MSEVASWGLIGPGNVGKELMRQLDQPHVAARLRLNQLPSFVMRSSGIYDAQGEPTNYDSLADIDDTDFPDVTFVAMPSTDDGEIALGYLSHILDRGRIAVTAEKGAMANNFDYLRAKSDNFARLGINATVGGGTRIMEQAKIFCMDPDNVTQIHMSLNGTLSHIMSLVGPSQGTGMSLGSAVHQSVELGYAEPGAETPYAVIKGEAEGDIPKKTAIFFNNLELSDEPVDWNELRFELTSKQIASAVEEARVRRFMVSLYSPLYLNMAVNCPEEQVIGGFDVKHNGWRLVGGFRHLDRNPLFSHLSAATGPSNRGVIGLGPDETDGIYDFGGPGAGVRPTANTMIDDYVVLSKKLA